MNLLKKVNPQWKFWGVSFFDIVVVSSGIMVGSLSWNVATLFKSWLLKKYNLSLYPWTDIFYHPHESSLINYIFLCICMGIYGLIIYLVIDRKDAVSTNTKAIPATARYIVMLIFAATILMFSLKYLDRDSFIITALFVAILFILLMFYYFAHVKKIHGNKLLLVLIGILYLILSLEPVNLIIGPISLMNEYENTYSETLLEGKVVNNKSYLERLSPEDIETIKSFYILNNKSKKEMIDKSDNVDFNLNPDIKFKDMESLKQFYLKNKLEYDHQNMSRGQINHIGHILNPINEFTNGKPFKDIYFQYGIGNTFIMKWTMDLFGKVSIEHYYKCYGYYILYFTIFLLMLFALFKHNIVYIYGVFSILAASHYYWRYIGFILAPGIIPTVHMFDVIILILLLRFFRHNSVFFLGATILFAFLALLINTQFGMMLIVPLLVSLILYVIENKTHVRKSAWFIILVAIFAAATLVPSLITTSKTEKLFTYFLLGLFSWPAPKLIIALTICYLAVSYAFLFFLKETRCYLKYVYIFTFLYTQSLFVYFYWSGLANHLPMVLPFAGLQLFLMIYILEQEFDKSGKTMSLIKVSVILAAVIFLVPGVRQFYNDKKEFQNNFTDHKVYHWTFDRAHILTTINPKPIENSLFLIWKYSTLRDNGIFIISRYDNILPFLADRYNYLSFELAWHLLSNKEVNDTIAKINNKRPQLLFVDSNIDEEVIDPWSKVYSSDSVKNERISRMGRYSELQKVFAAVRSDYDYVEQGGLLAVYRRRE